MPILWYPNTNNITTTTTTTTTTTATTTTTTTTATTTTTTTTATAAAAAAADAAAAAAAAAIWVSPRLRVLGKKQRLSRTTFGDWNDTLGEKHKKQTKTTTANTPGHRMPRPEASSSELW